MLATPTAANRTSWRVSVAGTSAGGASGARPSCERTVCSGSRPAARARPTRAMPRRSAIAVATTSTRLSGSSTQSTGHLVDAQTAALGEHQQLGVEEPTGVLDQRQQVLGDVPADRLEAALRVAEPGGQRAAQQQVVAARDDLSLGAADHPRPAGQPGADRDVGVPGHQRARRAAAARCRSVERSTSM